MVDALFSVNDDSSNQGYDADPLEVLTLKLKTQPVSGVSTVRFQIWDASSFDPDLDIVRNPPRKAKLSPSLLFDNGVATGPSVSPVTVGGEVTLTMPADRYHAWLIRCVVNGGQVTLADGRVVVDPVLIHERMIVVKDTDGNRPIVATETTQYEDDGWAPQVGVSGAVGPTGPTGGSSAMKLLRTEIFRVDGSLETIDADGNSVITAASTWDLQADGNRYRGWAAPGAPGGSRGRRVQAGNANGPSGAGGCFIAEDWWDRSFLQAVRTALGTAFPVVVGAGGAALPALGIGTATTNGADGNPGNLTRFHTLLVGYPGGIGDWGTQEGGGGGGAFGPGDPGATSNPKGGRPVAGLAGSNTHRDGTGVGGASSSGTSQGAGAAERGGGSGAPAQAAATAVNAFPGGRSLKGSGGSGSGGGAQTAGTARNGGAGGKTGPATDGLAVGGGPPGGVVGGTEDGQNGADGVLGVRGGEGGSAGAGKRVTGATGVLSGAGGNGGFPSGAGAPSGGMCVNSGTGGPGPTGKGGDGVFVMYTYG